MKTLLGQRIREQRRKKGWTMDKLAEKADLSVNYVGDLERGVKTPSLDTFIRIVEALDVPADVLIRDSAAPASYVADDELNQKIFTYFHPKFILGLTATPECSDGEDMLELFQNVAHKMDLKTAVERGVLVPIRCIRVKTNIDLTDVRINGIK